MGCMYLNLIRYWLLSPTFPLLCTKHASPFGMNGELELGSTGSAAFSLLFLRWSCTGVHDHH